MQGLLEGERSPAKLAGEGTADGGATRPVSMDPHAASFPQSGNLPQRRADEREIPAYAGMTVRGPLGVSAAALG